jgi:hypothetical protein
MSYHADYKGTTMKSIDFSKSRIIPKVEITSRVLASTSQVFSKGGFNLTWVYSENMTRFTFDTSFVEENVTSNEVWSALVLNNEDFLVRIMFYQ